MMTTLYLLNSVLAVNDAKVTKFYVYTYAIVGGWLAFNLS